MENKHHKNHNNSNHQDYSYRSDSRIEDKLDTIISLLESNESHLRTLYEHIREIESATNGRGYCGSEITNFC